MNNAVLQTKISTSLQENICYLNERLGADVNFDVITREIMMGGKKACIYVIDGFCKDEVMQKMLQYFMELEEEKVL